MPQDAQTLTSNGRRRPPLALDFDIDRKSAFRKARRHSIVVRLMRTVFPVTALALFASYGLFAGQTFKLGAGSGKVGAKGISLSTEDLVAHDPKYEGFNKDGGRYVVQARTAQQDFAQKGPVRLKGIDGRMFDASNAITDLKAVSGTYDLKTNVLELYEKIDVVSQNGMRAELTSATVHSKEGRIVSNEPATVFMPSGVVRGNTLLIEQKSKTVTFGNGVASRLKAEQKQAPRPGAGAAQRSSMDAGDQPVDITASTLVVNDATKLAVFSGNVIAKQGDQTLNAPVLEVTYDGQAAAGGSAPAAAGQASGGRLKRIVAKDDVVITRGQERATGKLAEFDAETEKAVLHGPVVMTAGPGRQSNQRPGRLRQPERYCAADRQRGRDASEERAARTAARNRSQGRRDAARCAWWGGAGERPDHRPVLSGGN